MTKSLLSLLFVFCGLAWLALLAAGSARRTRASHSFAIFDREAEPEPADCVLDASSSREHR